MDLLTQLQDKLDHLLHVFGICIGVLQRDAPPSSFTIPGQPPQPPKEEWDVPSNMALQVIETSKVIESYIEKLPGFDKTENQQYDDLKNLNTQSKQLSSELQSSRKDAIELLKMVKESIRYIAEESKEEEDEDSNNNNNNNEQQPMEQ